MPDVINDRLYSWASELDDGTRLQAERTARLPIVSGHVALMPDAHFGMGATVGSVVPTENAIVPSCVGVDIGCGMIAASLDAVAADLPDDLAPLHSLIAQAVPAGVGQGHEHSGQDAERWLRTHRPRTQLSPKQNATSLAQFGTLGSGNHFVEVCLDETDRVWVVLHSGSRGIGNQLAQSHIADAKRLAKELELRLEDPDLAYFMEGTREFDDYIADMLWAQDYALANRDQMMDAVLWKVYDFLGKKGRPLYSLNCHHNFTQRETHGDKSLWITRKGAIKADVGDRGIIPGSMGTATFIVRGLGNPLSWNSCSHGAGRRMSRGEAKRTFTEEDLAVAMKGKVWNSAQAGSLIDEIPNSYKDIFQVMSDQADLVEVEHTLTQILNFKGC